MKASYSWLKEHIALELPAKDLAEHLLRLGFEVVAIEKRGPDFSGVVTAQVLEVSKHPNADRLNLCVVDDGAQKLSIVCGAPNVAAGQKVALARIGAVLPGNFKIGKSKIRGVESHGMICSAKELGLPEKNGGGIMVLGSDTPLGQDFSKRAGEPDEILDVEITTNRPDCLSHLGLARELAAYFRMPLKTRPAGAPAGAAGVPQPRITVEAPQACPRYIGRVLTGLKIGPSPAWLASKLEAVGLRPINNLVDVTNYILMDLGQPMHAFDLDKLEGGEVRVRFAAAGEKLRALDGKDYELSPENLVIADARKPAAIAGVMGGLDSAVTEKTTRCLLESAHFFPPVVRKSSQRLKLRSDSSYRFERGTDLEAASAAADRATELILQLCGKDAKASAPADVGQKHAERPVIAVSAAAVNKILGSSFPEDAVEASLKAISAGLVKNGDELKFTPPSYRADLTTKWDLAEEAGRLLSYDNIPAKPQPVVMRPARITKTQQVTDRVRARLAALGLYEAYNYDLVSEKRLSLARLPEDAARARVANPLSDDWTTLRPALLPGLLFNAQTNLNRGAQSVRLFEVGKVYSRGKDGVEERWHAAGIVLGPAAEAFWKPARVPRADLYDALGLVADLLTGLPVERLPLKQAPGGALEALFNPANALGLRTPRGWLGAAGLLHPQAARAFELEREDASIFELDLDSLCELETPPARFSPFPVFPSSKRDLSVLVAASTPYGAVEAAARQAAGRELVWLSLIDVFQGKGVPEGKKSFTLRLTFTRADRTITDAEVNAAMEKVLAALKSAAGAELRG